MPTTLDDLLDSLPADGGDEVTYTAKNADNGKLVDSGAYDGVVRRVTRTITRDVPPATGFACRIRIDWADRDEFSGAGTGATRAEALAEAKRDVWAKVLTKAAADKSAATVYSDRDAEVKAVTRFNR